MFILSPRCTATMLTIIMAAIICLPRSHFHLVLNTPVLRNTTIREILLKLSPQVLSPFWARGFQEQEQEQEQQQEQEQAHDPPKVRLVEGAPSFL